MFDDLCAAVFSADAVKVGTDFAALAFGFVAFSAGDGFEITENYFSMFGITFGFYGERRINRRISGFADSTVCKKRPEFGLLILFVDSLEAREDRPCKSTARGALFENGQGLFLYGLKSSASGVANGGTFISQSVPVGVEREQVRTLGQGCDRFNTSRSVVPGIEQRLQSAPLFCGAQSGDCFAAQVQIRSVE